MKYIIFDMDRVLVDDHCREKALEQGYEIVAKKANVSVEKVRDSVVDIWRSKKNTVESYDWAKNIEEAGKKLGVDVKIEFEKLIKNNVENAIPYPEVIDTLKKLKETKYVLVLVTNGYLRFQEPILRYVGIMEYFNDIMTSDKTGFSKPDPRVLGKYAELGKEALYVDDLLYQGVHLGKQIGALTYLVKRGFDGITKDISTESLAKMLEEERAPENIKPEQVRPDFMAGDISHIPNIIRKM